MAGDTPERPDWRDDVDMTRVNVADDRCARAARAHEPRPLYAALDLLVPGTFVTVAEAGRRSTYNTQAWRVTAARAEQTSRDVRERLATENEARNRRLTAVLALLDHRRKTVRMSDLYAALEIDR